MSGRGPWACAPCNQPAPARLTPLRNYLPARLESGVPGGIVAGRLLRFRSISFSEYPMAPRANWKGFLRLSLVTCPVALYPATSDTEKVSFNQINRKTGHRIKY